MGMTIGREKECDDTSVFWFSFIVNLFDKQDWLG